MTDLALVLPFCAKDGLLALKNLRWIGELDARLDFDCVLSHDEATPPGLVAEMTQVAKEIFRSVDINFYPPPQKRYWPAAPNHAWQSAARYMAYKYKAPWLFLEADAVPIRRGWLTDINNEHKAAGKPFSGHLVEGLGHLNGVAVYPPDVAFYIGDALRVEETAWDVVAGSILNKETGGIMAFVHPSHTLFQHSWNINPETGKPWNGHGEPASFKSMNDVLRLVDITMGIFHRCKDGSLIDWLRKYHKDPSVAMVPQMTGVSNEIKTNGSIENVSGSVNVVPIPVERPKDTPAPAVEPTVAHPKTEIFIVTYGKPTKRASGLTVSDFDWLAWCLRSIRKHCRWFQGVTLSIPDRDAGLLKPIADEWAASKCGIPLRIKMFKEPPGKGFLMHEIVMASADEFVPKGTEYVLHVDSDVVFKERVTPDEYIKDGKPVYVWRTYDSLAEVRDGQQVVSDCAQWKTPTEAQLGFPVAAYTMCRHPSGFPVSFYKPYRDHIASLHGKPFMEYMLDGQNSWPQNRMDFTAMGAFAYERMQDSFSWIDVSGGNHLAPPDKQKCYWSHGSVTDHIKAEIEGFLK